ncbi:MAG TPA: tetratricopeptide repeat protein [Xanthobacteraceae bacterium]|jgi:tetratricopeptide (TPR) repeat protein/SAM-dependent methyltransferase
MSRKDRRAAGKRPGSPTADASAVFALAVRHHQAGQLLEAESLYRQVLASDGKHFGTLHHLGIIALQRGQAQAAADVIGRAIAINNRVPDCHYNMAFALQALGRLSEAVAHYRRAVELKPDYVEAHTNLGNVLKELGSHREAAACYERVIALEPSAEAHYNLANTLSRLGRLDEAVSSYRRALELKPDLVEAHNNLANALVSQGRLDDALMHFQRALALDPNLVEARVNLGTTLLQQGRLDAAVEELERAVGIDATFADAHSNLGNVYLAQGRLDEAAQRYRHALALKPEAAEAHNNLGLVLAARGDFAEASRSFREAIARRPDFVDAHNNLARASLSMGQPADALAALQRALAIAETTETKSLFVHCVRALPIVPQTEDFRSFMIRALSEPWGRANDLAPTAARVVKQDSVIKSCIARAMQAWPRRLPARELLDRSALPAISRHRLLRCLMESASIGDVELERLLTAVRFAMLELACAAEGASVTGQGRFDGDVLGGAVLDDEVLGFCCALARQCFLNEQVFALTEDELDRAQRLRDRVLAATTTRTPASEFLLAVVAAYFPLHSLPGAGSLLDKVWSDAVTAILVQQVREPAEERQLRASIPALTAVESDVSRQVRQQYEENPYPRWVKAEPAGQPLPFDQYLRRRLPAAAFERIGQPRIEILIAGCGTGQHAIETAQRFVGAEVLAVDLSLTSLAYATRKTRELGRSNIEYAQADILQLGALGRSFDLIESAGVLHHLADPLTGWRVLLSLLRPGGFMTLGLYSEIARADIVETRAFIAERGYQPTAEDIRRCRQDLLEAGARFGNVTASGDFFSTSGCRDLLFHVQEHPLTIPRIADFIAENDLAFIGFDLDHFTLQRYRAKFPHDMRATDLASWDAFEHEHPGTFCGMYQFWVQKKP